MKVLAGRPARRFAFYLHREFRGAGLRFYLPKEFRGAGLRFYLHKESGYRKVVGDDASKNGDFERVKQRLQGYKKF